MWILSALGFSARIPATRPVATFEGVRAGEVILIDVRTPAEWAQTGTPAGSHRIALEDKDLVAKAQQLAEANPHASITLSCFSGERARKAAKRLRRAGLVDLAILKGGITGWIVTSLPLDETVSDAPDGSAQIGALSSSR